MFLQFLQFGFLFSGVMFVLKASGLAPGLLVWSWLGCFTPVVIAAVFCVVFAFVDAVIETAADSVRNRRKGYL